MGHADTSSMVLAPFQLAELGQPPAQGALDRSERRVQLNGDFAEAETLPSIVYRDEYIFQHLKENLFFGSWQWLGGTEWLSTPHAFTPVTFMPGYINEPLIVVKEGDQISCLSNVCTHRANLLIESPFTMLHPEGIRGIFNQKEIDEILYLTEKVLAA